MKVCRPLRETNFRLIQAFNWSRNTFGEIQITQGIDWSFPSQSLLLISDCVASPFVNDFQVSSAGTWSLASRLREARLYVLEE